MSGFQRSTLCSSLFALVLLIGVVSSTNASAQTVRNLRPGSPEFLERCKSWIERKGFPVDYIEQKTGKRQPGFAVDWKGNVKPDDARAGDVAIIRRTYPDGRTIEAAGYIESVEAPVGGSGAFVTVSAMGRGGNGWTRSATSATLSGGLYKSGCRYRAWCVFGGRACRLNEFGESAAVVERANA